MLFHLQLFKKNILRQRTKEISGRKSISIRRGRFGLPMAITLLILMCSRLASINLAQEKTAPETPAPSPPKTILLSEQDIADTINCFRTDDARKSIEILKAKMPHAVSDKKFREEVMQKLPAAVKQLKINDAEITEIFRKIIAPVLSLYEKDKSYNIIVFRHSTPVMFSDSGVALVVSTAMIKRAASDDELLGFAAHEVGHEYYGKASVYTKYILGFVTAETSDQALARKYWESLGLIELQCDGFSALTLAHLGYDPLAFIEGLERVERDFPEFAGGYHPPAEARRKLVEAIISPKTSPRKAQMSAELRKLKEMLAAGDK
jgi:hypothetical protein